MTDTHPAPLPLPQPNTADGEARRVGVEVEFAGLDEAAAARIVAGTLGGHPRQTAPFTWAVEGGELGDIQVLLDTRFRKDADTEMVKTGLELSHGLVPVEIVTQPIRPQDIPRLDAVLQELAAKGATGTESALLQGFGTHLNVEIAGASAMDIAPVLTAYALAEAGLRAATPIDRTRAVLPFVAPYPAKLLDRLAERDEWTLHDLARTYLDEAPSRNHALDMLPVFAHLMPEMTEDALGKNSGVSARPAYHFRLPDSRIGDDDWSLCQEWNRWVAIERLAGDPCGCWPCASAGKRIAAR